MSGRKSAPNAARWPKHFSAAANSVSIHENAFLEALETGARRMVAHRLYGGKHAWRDGGARLLLSAIQGRSQGTGESPDHARGHADVSRSDAGDDRRFSAHPPNELV